jgi:uncharacterized membrane protein
MDLRRFVSPFGSRPRLFASAVLGFMVGFFIPEHYVASFGTRGLIGWNVFALAYLVLAIRMMARAQCQHIIRNAVHEDDGALVVLTLVVLASIAVLTAVGTQLATVRDLHGPRRDWHIALAGVTVVTSWFFTQTSFALHYAHDFFLCRSREQPDGLQFPGTADPTYIDFLYFACVIGTSGQTADVSMTSSAMRVIGLVHCVQAFFFNTTVLALVINIAAGLF